MGLDQLSLHSEFKLSLNCIARRCLEKEKSKKENERE